MPSTGHAMSTVDLDLSREAGKPPVLRTPRFDSFDRALDWLTEHQPELKDELHRSGSLLIRGLGVGDASDFGRVRDVLMPRRAGYKEKATPRTDFGEGVFSSTDLPAVQPIRLHNENSYTLDFPGTLLFGCVIAPEEGGATTVGDMREALRLLPPALRDRFAATGWLLVRNFSELAGLPWQKSFATEDPAVVEAYCRDNTIGFEWREDGALRTRQRRSAIVTHAVTGEKSWFNHFAFWNNRTLDTDVRDVLVETYGEDGLPFDTFVGDGTRLTQDEVETVNRIYDQVTLRETWQRGDVMLVDNVLCAHGRESYRGDRKILVAMGDPITLDACRPETAPSTTAFEG
ncbi:TauD/TfdA family dioxygenase [Streptomyces sp. AK02-01A]|uniref:TauD/TfdA family dioxygenase n=1 Tax=Streptomyces sp. AK02-01A TaxID=3028648 RepID=UPI0029A67702|nr:TauD/TfdA family dioxygenase [Streptomyces sp. AK02-01A]MDX3855890.1 TauD/TfdA family dioxygenase [Streptomyces sp. AK02-01A]